MNSKNKAILQKATSGLIQIYLDDLKFVEALPLSLKCFHCETIIKMPFQVSCGHRVCKQCIDPLLSTLLPDATGVRHCPDDGDEILEDSFFQDNSALKEILLLVCFCIRTEDGCEWQGLVMEFEDHLAKCEFNTSGTCPFEQTGCDFQGTGSQIKKHLEGEPIKHHTLVVSNVRKFHDSVEENTEKMQHIRKGICGLNSNFRDIEDYFKKLQDYIREANESLDNEPDWFETNRERLGKFNDQLYKEIDSRNKLLDQHINKVAELANEIKETNESGSYVERVESVSEKLRRLLETHNMNTSLMGTIDLKAKLYQATTFDGVFIWKLDNLRNRFTEAVSGKVTELFTPPLHTSRHGYKFSAKVLLNGEKRDFREGNRVPHIAFYIALLQGDYDEILEFPFPHTIKVTLLNMGKQEDIVHFLIPDEKVHFQKPFRDMNPAIGFSKFCSHDSLYSKDFVKDDAIYIKIEVEKSRYQR